MKKYLAEHLKAARLLCKIRDKVLRLLKEKKMDYTEKEIARFILKEYRLNNLQTSGRPKVIVAFGKSTATVHNFPKKVKPREGPIMLDMWARTANGFFADLTWMAYKGKPDKKFTRCFRELVRARDEGLKFLRKCLKEKYLPTSFELDAIVRAYLARKRIGYAFQHRVCHHLSKALHAGGKKEYYKRLKVNQPYTLEPGLYFKGRFGIRLENNFWIDTQLRLHLEHVQSKLLI